MTLHFLASPFLPVALTFSLCGMGFSQQEGPKRWALLVGISDYSDPAINPLRFAAHDAKQVAAALEENPHSGFIKERIVILADRHPMAPKKVDMYHAFEKLRSKIEIQDSLIVFISSHGIEHDGVPYIIASDTQLDDIQGTALPIPELFRLIRSIPVKTRILLIDACHSGMSNQFPTGSMGFGMHDALESGSAGSAVLSSSKIGQESFESDQHGMGVFTYYLCKALHGEPGVDRDHDGQLSLEEAAIFVERGLMDWGRTSRRIQQPWIIRTGAGAPPILVSLVPTVDIFGAQARTADHIGTLRHRYQIKQQGGLYLVNSTVTAEHVPLERCMLSFLAVLENGAVISWRQPFDPRSRFNVLPQKTFDVKPTRIEVEEKLYNLEMTSYLPVRVVAE